MMDKRKKRIITKGNRGNIEQIQMCLRNFHRKKAPILSIMEMKVRVNFANGLAAVEQMCVLTAVRPCRLGIAS